MKKISRKRRIKKPAWGKLAILAAVVFVMFLAWRYTPLAEVITADNVLDLARETRDAKWSPLLVLLVYTPAAFVLFPRPLITLFAVIAYGPWLGFAIAMTGIMGSAVAVYYTGRTLPGETLRELAGDKATRATEALKGRGFVASLAVSIAPVAPFPVIGMVAGHAGVPLFDYLGGTAVGMLPGTLATTAFADQLAKVLDDPSQINYWIVAGVVLFFVVLMLGVRRWLGTLRRRPAH